MIFRTSLVRCSKPIFSGPSVKAHYDQTLQKLNLGLTGHVAGGALMLISSSAFGASPFTTALFAGILWMQVMSWTKHAGGVLRRLDICCNYLFSIVAEI